MSVRVEDFEIEVVDGVQDFDGVRAPVSVDMTDHRVVVSNDGNLEHLAAAALYAGFLIRRGGEVGEVEPNIEKITGDEPDAPRWRRRESGGSFGPNDPETLR